MTVVHQSQGFFDYQERSPVGILPLQISPSAPTLPTMQTGTGLLAPDVATEYRLTHFDPTLYDLRPESHLVRFCKALLGDTGVGQLRKRYTVARLQSDLSSTHFYDLDGFYGSLFGVQRKVEEQLPINPMSQVATSEDWDDIATRDARFRERVYALARALPMAGTVPGLKAAAEALTGVECDIYETWSMVEQNPVLFAGRTWDNVATTFSSYDAIEKSHQSWRSVFGASSIGRGGLNSRHEVYVRPKTDYSPADGSQTAMREAERQRIEDEMGLQRVLNVLKPSGVLLTIDNQGIPLMTEVKAAGFFSDSNYWEIVTKVRPRTGLEDADLIYPTSAVPAKADVDPGAARQLPLPPFSGTDVTEWSYNSAITTARGLLFPETPGKSPVKADGPGISTGNEEGVLINGVIHRYRVADAIIDHRTLASAQGASDNQMVAHPYSGPRTAAITHG